MTADNVASRPRLLPLAAATAEALDQASAELAHHLESDPAVDLAAVADRLTAELGDAPHRRALVASDVADAAEVLRSADSKRLFTAVAETGEPPVAFMFSGQGAQYPGMGAGLYAAQSVFRNEVDRCCEVLEPLLGLDLRRLLFPAAEGGEEAAGELEQTRNTQPALFVVEYATARLWQSWGVRPQAMIGHSIGEYGAACLAGVLDLEAALTLVAARGQLMQSLPPGDMLTVPMDEEELRQELPEELSIATLNARGRTVVSGPAEAIDAFREGLAARRVRAALLHTSHAFHSAMMEPILEPFTARVRQVELRPPRIPYVSNVSGTWITASQATDASYWATHLRQAVRFADGAGELLAESRRVLLEVGPGNTLASLAGRHPAKGPEHRMLSSIRHPKKQADDLAFLLETLAQLWLAGVDVDWRAVRGGGE